MSGGLQISGQSYGVTPFVRPLMLEQSIPVAVSVFNAANTTRISRCVVPKSGKLRDIAVFVGTPSGNIRGVVYDNGEASNGNLTLIHDGGSHASALTNSWDILSDPNLSVVAGQHIWIGVQVDNVTVTIGRTAPVSTNAGLLPTGYLANSTGIGPVLNHLEGTPGSFTAVTTISNASLTNTANLVAPIVAIGRIS